MTDPHWRSGYDLCSGLVTCDPRSNTLWGMATTSSSTASRAGTEEPILADEANRYIQNRRETELHKVLIDQGMRKWMHKTRQETTLGTRVPRIRPPKGMWPQTNRVWKVARPCVNISRPMGRSSGLYRPIPPPTSARLWRGSALGATNASEERLPPGGRLLEPDPHGATHQSPRYRIKLVMCLLLAGTMRLFNGCSL